MLRYRRLSLKIENKEERKRLFTHSNEKHHIVSIRKKISERFTVSKCIRGPKMYLIIKKLI